MSEVSLNVSPELLETVAELVAECAAALLAAHVAGSTPWMTTDEAIDTFLRYERRASVPRPMRLDAA